MCPFQPGHPDGKGDVRTWSRSDDRGICCRGNTRRGPTVWPKLYAPSRGQACQNSKLQQREALQGTPFNARLNGIDVLERVDSNTSGLKSDWSQIRRAAPLLES